MSISYLGEIRMFAGDFAPQGWALCDGSLLSIQDNANLFSLIGNTYGGDGKLTFALPDLQQLSVLHMSSEYQIGDQGESGSINQSSGESGIPTDVVSFRFIISMAGVYPSPNGGSIDALIGEGRIFSFPFAPYGWTQCDGQVLGIPQDEPLFKILGTAYGGDGTTTFALPNLQGALPVESENNAPGKSGTASAGVNFLTLNLCISLQGNVPPRSQRDG
jgi:microcystin-dependent protein